jgi:hypothetical protein
VLTKGNYLGFTIGDTKRAAFAQVVTLEKTGQIEGFIGSDSQEVVAIDRQNLREQAERLVLHDMWHLVAQDGRRVVLTFLDGKVGEDGIWPTDSSRCADAWSPSDNLVSFTTGMDMHAAIDLLEKAFAEGSVTRIEVHSSSIDRKPPYGTFESLEPWDTWILGNSEYDKIRLDFEAGRLVKIHHRKGGLMNWLTATPV